MSEDSTNDISKAEKGVFEERRKCARISCRLEIEANSGEDWFILNSRNIGLGGMMLTAEADIEKLKKLNIYDGEKVLLSFYLPKQSDLIKTYGKVVHVRRKTDTVEEKEISLIGIQFINLTVSVKKQLELFVYGGHKNPLL